MNGRSGPRFRRDPVRWATLEADMADAALEATPPPALPPVLDGRCPIASATSPHSRPARGCAR